MKYRPLKKVLRVILKYLSYTVRHLGFVNEYFSSLLKDSKKQSKDSTVMITTDCNETFASVNQIDVNLVDFLRGLQQLNQKIQELNLSNIELINEVLKKNLEDLPSEI